MITDPIPSSATKVFYSYGGAKGYFRVWPYGDNWIWSAQGMQGKEVTFEKALNAARSWIIDETKPKQGE